jgi:hypothetical protein
VACIVLTGLLLCRWVSLCVDCVLFYVIPCVENKLIEEKIMRPELNRTEPKTQVAILIYVQVQIYIDRH